MSEVAAGNIIIRPCSFDLVDSLEFLKRSVFAGTPVIKYFSKLQRFGIHIIECLGTLHLVIVEGGRCERPHLVAPQASWGRTVFRRWWWGVWGQLQRATPGELMGVPVGIIGVIVEQLGIGRS
jgi:hypothetical protein